MSDLTTYEPSNGVVQYVETYQDQAVRRLADWAHSAEAAHSIAKTLVQTSFCPDSFRDKPGEATAAILAGLEVGLQPMAALRSFDVIQGQAAPRAITLRAIVQAHGHELELEESTATRCKMRGRRRGSQTWQSVTWTIDRAKALGLTGKKNWRDQPQAMLVARATGELARLVASDAILGIGYTVEEIGDGEAPSAPTVAEAAPTRRMSRPKPAPAEPEIVDAEPVEEPPEFGAQTHVGQTEEYTPEEIDGDGPITDRTRGQMFALLSELGIDDADTQRHGMSKILGRTVESRSTLTEDEGRAIVLDLQGRLAARDAEATA